MIKSVLCVMTAVMMCGVRGVAAEAKPVKVFIMAGQSNMEGHARVTTIDYK